MTLETMPPRTPSRPGPGRARADRLVLPALLLAAFAVYGRTLAYPFVLDDHLVITGNSFLKAPGNPLLLLVSDYSRGAAYGPGYFRPLMMLTFWLQGTLLGWVAAPFHLVNVALHGLTAWALHRAARALGCGAPGALAGALLFLVFPPGQEPIGSIVGRGDLLAALFFLLGWRAQLDWEAGRLGAGHAGLAVFGFGLLAMLGKESAATYPAAVAWTAIVLARRERAAGPGPAAGLRRPQRAALVGAAALALGAYLGLRLQAVGRLGLDPAVLAETHNPVAALPQPGRTYAALYGTGRLLLALIAPARLACPREFRPDGPPPLAGPLDPGVALPAAALLLLAAAAAAFGARGRRAAVPLAFVLLNLLPVSNLLLVNASFVAERFLYLPFAGVALLAALGWEAAARRLAARAAAVRGAAAAAAAALLCACGLVASARVAEWRSEETVARSWSRLAPWSPVPWNRLGLAALGRGDLPAARAHLERSLRLDPENPRVLGHLGTILLRAGEAEEAGRRLRQAVAMKPADPDLRAGLARALLASGRIEEGLREAQAAHALRPALAEARHLLATALFEAGRYAEAERHFRALLADEPSSARLHHALILSLRRALALEAAERAAEEARRRFPADPLFRLWGARLAVRRGRLEEALRHLEEGRSRGGPVGAWLAEVEDLAPLRDDPRARRLSER